MDQDLKKILVVDDSMFVRELLKEALSNRFDIITAGDGDEAVKKYKATMPDMVLLDITMPVQGLSALRAIRKFDPRSRVIMVSAIGTRKNVKESLDLGALDFINKPFEMKDLLGLIEKHIDAEPQQKAGDEDECEQPDGD